MAWDQQGGTGGFGGPGGFPPPPLLPPAPPPPPPDAARAVAVGLLNLSGLGLGYALTRRPAATVVCWLATTLLLVAALPADPDGVPGRAVAAYLLFLVLAALHGAARGLRTPLSWPPRSPVAVLLGLLLLAAPAGGVALYDGARDDATQQMLLDRLAAADRLVEAAGTEPFADAEPHYRDALTAYRDLRDRHPDSRAARRVPDRLNTYYATVAAPYDRKDYCGAVAPLQYLRTVPATLGGKGLGFLAGWPDDRLATSLYACGVEDLADPRDAGAAGTPPDDLADLLTTFPGSPQAARVEPAVRSTIDKAARDLDGADPCTATDRLRALGRRASDLDAKDAGGALVADARRAGGYVRSGTYSCGLHQYLAGDFDGALTTMSGFVKDYPDDRNRPLADKTAIAAEIARHESEAGRRLPTLASGGGISVTVSNDSPDEVEVLYTGPVTGRFTLKACGACSTYPTRSQASADACRAGRSYPRKTLHLPPGTTYFLHKPTGGSADSPGEDTALLEDGYLYTECAYTVETGLAL
ncbi:hypothetical protein [Actinacidiphila sp. ITFR-21]|uniref:hypothetical protein n=1 Tax=Actinacidiphila sp. ITFR-21 TaxID=3075199 RepID=UPI002889820E|nr:hypothetical protein [Streptomyces sp. ITFR-21]WNI14370.1 hypothetical protein RLT57_01670 [Streptomyces sp. ITFR-21]